MAKYRGDYPSPPSKINFCSSCTRCSIGQEKENDKNSLAVGGAGPEDLTRVRLIVLSDHPGFYEERYRFPFVNKQEVQAFEYESGKRKKKPDNTQNAGYLMRYMIEQKFDIDSYNDCYLSNVIKCDPGKRTIQDSHLRTCSSWLRSEFIPLDEYCPKAPVLIAGTKAARAISYTFKDFKSVNKGGINALRRRDDLRLGSRPVVFTYNPAIIARSNRWIEIDVDKRSKRVKKSRPYPFLPGSPLDFFNEDLELLRQYL